LDTDLHRFTRICTLGELDELLPPPHGPPAAAKLRCLFVLSVARLTLTLNCTRASREYLHFAINLLGFVSSGASYAHNSMSRHFLGQLHFPAGTVIVQQGKPGRAVYSLPFSRNGHLMADTGIMIPLPVKPRRDSGGLRKIQILRSNAI
jgi:hypothetical protein